MKADERELRRIAQEREWLRREVEASRGLSDADRTRILNDLVLAYEAIRRGMTPEEIDRADAARRKRDDPGILRYRLLAERLA